MTLENGVLTYDAFIGYLEAKHGVPSEYFYPKPQLDLLDVNGIKKDVPAEDARS
jgi:hypothetical protein